MGEPLSPSFRRRRQPAGRFGSATFHIDFYIRRLYRGAMITKPPLTRQDWLQAALEYGNGLDPAAIRRYFDAWVEVWIPAPDERTPTSQLETRPAGHIADK